MEKRQMRGIVVGVLVGLLVAFALQFVGAGLWFCLGAGLLLGLEAGFFSADPKSTLACHRRVIDKVNIDLHLPKINWQNWTWPAMRKGIGDVAVAIFGVVVLIGYLYAYWFCGEIIFSMDRTLGGFSLFIATLCGVISSVGWALGLGTMNFLMTEPKAFPANRLYFKCKTYRQRWLFRCVIGPLVGPVVMCGYALWAVASVCLLPVYLLAGACALARRHENAVITVGIIAGILAGFIFGYAQNFAPAMELVACVIGAVAGLVAGALVALAGRVADRCMSAYVAVALWKRLN